MNRKQFLEALLRFAAGVALMPGRGVRPATGALPERFLGRTGDELPILALGGYHLGESTSEIRARTLVETALLEGIRLFDTAESYQSGRSERWLGAALAERRSDVFLMTKTFDFPTRSSEGAQRHLEQSLARLGTDRLDLWQLHSIRSVEDVERAFRPGGAMEFILEAKRKGLTRFVGVTGHKDPAAHLRALELWDEGWKFDVMQLPLNAIDYHQRSFQRSVLPQLVRRGIGVVAMKTSASGALLKQRLCSIDETLRFAWSLPVDVAVVGMETPEQVRRNCRIARGFRAMSKSERHALLERLEPHARLELEWYKS